MMNKKGVFGILPSFLVNLIYSLVLILLITLLLVLIWNSIFGNDNKTEKDNFETLYRLIESKSKSNAAYDSTKVTIYLVKTGIFTTDHNIIFFSDETALQCDNGKPIYRPSECGDTTVSCLCLYDSDPDRAEDEKDDDVIMCKRFSTLFKISREDYQIANYSDDCKRSISKEYLNLIVGVQNTNTRRVFVWENTEENRKMDEQLKKQSCPEKTGICAGRKDSEIVYALNDVNTACRAIDPNKYYWEAKCVFKDKKCELECLGEDCSKISSCSDFNFNKDFYIKNSKEEFFCNNNICNKQCVGNLIEQYSCINGKEQDCKDLINNNKLDAFTESCSVEIGQYSSLINSKKNYNNAKIIDLGDITAFDSKKQNSKNYDCKGEIEKYFKKQPVLICIPGIDCTPFITKNPPVDIKKIITDCEANPMRVAGTVVITKSNNCNELTKYFTEANTCSDKKIERFV